MPKHNSEMRWTLMIIVLLAVFRLVPHAPNFTPIGAMALLAGMWIRDMRTAFVLPLTAMLLSDLLLGLHSTMLYVYTAFLMTTALGRYLARYQGVRPVLAGALISSLLFFIITNFGAWLEHDMYSRNIEGLLQAYAAGIPFYRNTLVSSLMFSLLGYYAITKLVIFRGLSSENRKG